MIFLDKTEKSGGINQNQTNLVERQERSLPKGHTEKRPFFYCKFLKYRIYHILRSRVESTEHIGFDSDVSTVIVDNYDNEHIF